MLNIQRDVNTFDYLGTALALKRDQRLTWHNTIRCIQARIARWRGSTLSPEGLRTLIQLVTTAIPIYWLGHQTIPVKVLKLIKTINSNFLWSGNGEARGLHPMAWDKIKRPIHEGGLGLQDLNTQSNAILAHLVWWFQSQPDSYWASLLSQKYLSHSSFKECTPKAKDPILWKKMLLH